MTPLSTIPRCRARRSMGGQPRAEPRVLSERLYQGQVRARADTTGFNQSISKRRTTIFFSAHSLVGHETWLD